MMRRAPDAVRTGLLQWTLAAALAMAAHVFAGQGTATMSDSTQATEVLRGIDEGQLLGGSEGTLVADAYRLLAKVRWNGIALRVPSMVNLGSAQAVRIVVAVAQTAARQQEVVLGNNAVIITNGLDEFGRASTRLFPEPESKIPIPTRPPAPPPESSSTVKNVGSTSVQRVDLKAQGALPWRAGRYAVRVFAYDWVSEAAVVTLAGAAARGPASAPGAGPVVDTRTNIVGSWTGGVVSNTLPNFNKLSVSPQLAADGVALQLFARPVAGAGPVPVVGSLRMSIPGWRRPVGTGPIAIVHGFLVLARRGIVQPILVDIQVPLFHEGQSAPRDSFNGYFAFDLNRLRTERLPAGQYQVYLVVAEHTAGPYRLQVE
jgi:hypothetical protein